MKKKKYVVYPIEILYLVIIITLVFGFPSFLSYVKSAFFSGNAGIEKVAEIIIKDNNVSEESVANKTDKTDKNELNKKSDVLSADEKKFLKTAFMINEQIFVKNADSLECFDYNGKKLWTRPLKSVDTHIQKWNDKYIIVDKYMGGIALVNSENEVEIEKNNFGKFESLALSKNRLFIKLLEKNEILVLDENLEEINRITEKNGDIIKIAASFKESELICYNTSISEDKLKSFVVIYDENAKILGTLDLGESILFDVFADENISLICDDKVLTYTKNARPLGELINDGTIVDAGLRGKSLYTIDENTAGEKKLILYSELLEEEKSEKLSDGAKFLSLGEKRLLVGSDKRIVIYDYGLKNIEEINLTIDINEIDWITSNVFYTVTDNKLTIYSTN